mgnify:FL=1
MPTASAFLIPSALPFDFGGFRAMCDEAELRLFEFFSDRTFGQANADAASDCYDGLLSSGQRRGGARFVADVTGAPFHVAAIVFAQDLALYKAMQ